MADEHAEEHELNDSRMSLGEHLHELRRRLVRGILALVVVFIVAWNYYEQIKNLVLGPYERARGLINAHAWERAERILLESPDVPRERFFNAAGELVHAVGDPVVLGAPEGFLFALKTCFYFALFIGGPILLWQLWQFVATGLYKHERKSAMRYFPWSVLLFMGGVLFGYFILVPYAFFYLATAFPIDEISPVYTLTNYLSFLSTLSLALGCVFQLPVLMVFFTRLGLIEPATFKHYRGHFIVGSFVLSAVLTPPDPVTQLMMAVPIVVLFELGLVLSRIFALPRVLPPGEA
jgi:sec-independent protein translocase protein TatC